MGREEDWKGRGAGGRQLRLESIKRKLRTRTDGPCREEDWKGSLTRKSRVGELKGIWKTVGGSRRAGRGRSMDYGWRNGREEGRAG